jgi:ATP/maltotriose-dependent transcriptional regulator MalT
MAGTTVEVLLSQAAAALEAGRWQAARDAFAGALGRVDSADAWMGLAQAAWWLGDTRESVDAAAHAFRLYRRADDTSSAVEAAVWLGLTYKSDYANTAAAAGWLGRAERLLTGQPAGPLHAWVWLVRAYRNPDLADAEALTTRAVVVARAAGDVDTELVCLSQLGHIRVGMGRTEEGFALIDEAMAAVLGGEGSRLDSVVYVCCDMLSACDLACDAERAAQWCRVADDFIQTYGCPFLYAECRTLYGGLLVSVGRWVEAERELGAAVRITLDGAPALHARATVRLANLRLRQGRLEECAALLDEIEAGVRAEAEASLLRAALCLARGDGPAAGQVLEHRLQRLGSHRALRAEALELLVPAHLAAGSTERASNAAEQLAALVIEDQQDRVAAAALTARGRVAAADGDNGVAEAAFEAALSIWSALELPYETACCQLDQAALLGSARPEVTADQARRALSTFERLGAARQADRAAALLRSIGRPARPQPRSREALTSRERQVLDLLAIGLSNPEIAQRLYISRKTAAHHVSSILAKLLVRNRAEAAAFAQRTSPALNGPAD